MLTYATLATMLQAPVLLEGQGVQMLYAQVAQLLAGRSGGASEQERPVMQLGFSAFTPHAAALGVQSYATLDEVPAGSVAVHSIAGVMMPFDSWYAVGTGTIGQRVQQADAHPSFIGHVGVFNTPGGSTMGLENFAGIIAGTQKPFVSYVQQACSAGYWGASGGNAVMLAGRTAMCGSIGTMAEFLDFTGYFEQLGIKTVRVNATKSTNKNASFQAAIDGDPEPLRAEILDPLNEVFLSTVSTNRGDKIPAKQLKLVTSGMVFVGEACLANGLADLMGSLDEAIALAEQLANEADTTDSSPSSSTTSMSLFAKKLTLGAAAHALVSAVAITPEQATAANAELTAAGVTGAQLITEAAFEDLTTTAGRATAAEASLQLVTTALAAAGATDIAALVAQRDGFKVKADKFDKAPGAAHTGTALEAGRTDVELGEPSAHQKAIDALPHNQALAGNPLFGPRIKD
ncbi:S49 family peptidase [Hymenobacter sp. H14-R3]|uniref:S49 family peptidase n=1 Tax=Hymenobacter sp. H14-R3 TaxID=3046308 RepID=UPI0024BB595A|nr:S49 family peptidase [Hymenobacter sp. H14-R3]MDJ0367299.1 S49 family peptidase [Hymenobacter sp. H14-R3]